MTDVKNYFLYNIASTIIINASVLDEFSGNALLYRIGKFYFMFCNMSAGKYAKKKKTPTEQILYIILLGFYDLDFFPLSFNIVHVENVK